jgi:hypothetical protein
MTPEKSKAFLKVLGLLSILWAGGGWFFFHEDSRAWGAFVSIYIPTVLDLLCLIILFWILFFTPPTRRGRNFLALIFLTFKLVCLGFLAITLKRLRNAPDLAVLYGVGFMGLGPLISAAFYARSGSNRQR